MLPKIGMLCAGDDELAPFLPLLDRRSVRRQAMLTIHRGMDLRRSCRRSVQWCLQGQCGHRCNQVLIASCRVASRIINAGTAGGIDPSISML